MPSSNALDPQSPQARAIYELAIHSTIIFALIWSDHLRDFSLPGAARRARPAGENLRSK